MGTFPRKGKQTNNSTHPHLGKRTGTKASTQVLWGPFQRKERARKTKKNWLTHYVHCFMRCICEEHVRLCVRQLDRLRLRPPALQACFGHSARAQEGRGLLLDGNSNEQRWVRGPSRQSLPRTMPYGPCGFASNKYIYIYIFIYLFIYVFRKEMGLVQRHTQKHIVYTHDITIFWVEMKFRIVLLYMFGFPQTAKHWGSNLRYRESESVTPIPGSCFPLAFLSPSLSGQMPRCCDAGSGVSPSLRGQMPDAVTLAPGRVSRLPPCLPVAAVRCQTL